MKSPYIPVSSVQPTWNTLKQELISTLMPMFLGNHPNSAVVLHYAWHCQGLSSTIRTLIMHSMAEWYMRGEPHDQGRLSRILDVAQDLKVSAMLRRVVYNTLKSQVNVQATLLDTTVKYCGCCTELSIAGICAL